MIRAWLKCGSDGAGCFSVSSLACGNRLVGLVVFKASASRAAGLSSIPACSVDLFFGSNHTSDFNDSTPVVILPIASGTGWPGVSIASFSCIFFSVWQHAERLRRGDTLACCRDVKQSTHNNNLLHAETCPSWTCDSCTT